MELPTEDEKSLLQSLAGQLKGSDAQQRSTIHESMIEILDPYITKSYIERLDEEFKMFASIDDVLKN